ncbi:hypothetical protein PR048_020889 [Dryococelus australis]|uniref:Peptidase aspartic putative domain-containing protein n=1 Tax=Dryococelus australis TaxID=614101 RepID=A0ABQ9GWR5_9NEOP|nr:hypothetical protein PR048_020889 [Dryococelus australis]
MFLQCILSQMLGNNRQLQLADPSFARPGEVDILLGAEIFPQLLTGKKVIGSPGMPTAIDMLLGWVLMGCVLINSDLQPGILSFISNVQQPSLNEVLKNFWELEELLVVGHITTSPRRCVM